MKKKLEADLISIAHKVLQMKNKSDVNQLWMETQKLYEKLSVLRFIEEHFEEAKPTIGQAEVVNQLKQLFDEDQFSANLTSPITPENHSESLAKAEIHAVETVFEEEIKPHVSTEIESQEETEIAPINQEFENKIQDKKISKEAIIKDDALDFLPAFELDQEFDTTTDTFSKHESIQISFEELLGVNYSDTLFVKAEPKTEGSSLDFELPKPVFNQEENHGEFHSEDKNALLNDKQTLGFNIGLNDKIGFVKHLFDNSEEDYSRVINQLITFDNFEDAQNFIDDMVKPDYGNWEGKEDYEQRFIAIVEKKFV